MTNLSVVAWLEGLRGHVECYECEMLMRHECARNAPPPQPFNEGMFDVKFGNVCRVSVRFEEVGKVRVVPVAFAQVDADLSEDVGMWKQELKYKCFEEEDDEHIIIEELLNDITDNEGANLNNPNTLKFPASDDEGVEFRKISNNQHTDRPKTISSPSSDKITSHEKITLKTKLYKLLGKRSSRDFLESKGILKNEAIFGNTIQALCKVGIPDFLTKIVELIEEPSNLKTEGIYRIPANLATIQKIRCQVDNGQLQILDQYANDIEVLTGTLKLFFRELKEALIPFDIFMKLENTIDSNKERIVRIKQIMKSLPNPNFITLKFLLAHMNRVCDYKEYNKMDHHNIAVAWGPSLVTVPDSSDLVLQSSNFYKVTKYLLENYGAIFNTLPTRKISVEVPTAIVRTQSPLWKVTEKLTRLIEKNITVEGIYRKNGSHHKIDKLLRKIEKHKLDELDKHKNEVHELCGTLKRHLSSLKEPLIPPEMFENYCRDLEYSEAQAQQQVRYKLSRIPDSPLQLLLIHLRKVIANRNQNHTDETTIITLWADTLMDSKTLTDTKARKQFTDFFAILVQNEKSLPDILRAADVRFSRYDNVRYASSENIRGEADILENTDL